MNIKRDLLLAFRVLNPTDKPLMVCLLRRSCACPTVKILVGPKRAEELPGESIWIAPVGAPLLSMKGRDEFSLDNPTVVYEPHWHGDPPPMWYHAYMRDFL